jgi:phosphoribosylcarboxyaminoimidazole (NCAIR) mutase
MGPDTDPPVVIPGAPILIEFWVSYEPTIGSVQRVPRQLHAYLRVGV